MESYAEFLLQSRNPDNWVSRLPNDQIKIIALHLLIPTFEDLDVNGAKWYNYHLGLSQRLDEYKKSQFDKQFEQYRIEMQKYLNETYKELFERSKDRGEWLRYNHNIYGESYCYSCEYRNSYILRDSDFILNGTYFTVCHKHTKDYDTQLRHYFTHRDKYDAEWLKK